MNHALLKAALYTEAVLPAGVLLTAHDPFVPALLDGPPLGVVLSSPGGVRIRLAMTPGGIQAGRGSAPGDLHIWFPHPACLVRAFQQRPTLALPVGGWRHLRTAASRLRILTRRLTHVLDDRAAARRDPSLAPLHVLGNLLAGLAGAACWLQRHPDGPARRERLGAGLAVFAGHGLPAEAWLDLGSLEWGLGRAPREADVRMFFASTDVALDEIDHRLDTLAALNTGMIRATGKLSLAEALGLVMLEVERLLHPRTQP